MRPPEKHHPPLTVSFVSLGCPKNLVDSEKMLGLLAEQGLIPTADDDADVIVVNTCGFLESAKAESLAHIREAVARKRAGGARRVVVAGCLATRMGRQLLQEVPGVDAVVGVDDRAQIVAAVSADVATPPPPKARRSAAPPPAADTARLRLTPRHYAYLRVSEGCSRGCSFCTIPAIRGPMRSKPIETIEAEARELIADGAIELNLIGQDTTSYGADIGFDGGLAELVRRLDRLDGARWLRLLYAYPSAFTDEMIDAIGSADRFVPYIDLPLQHVSDPVLKRMRRRVTRRQIESLLERLRRRMPDLAIRTTFIAGFPGETEADHRELVAFVRDFGFDMLGVFCYSQEPGTPAARLAGQLDEPVKRARADAILAEQQQVVARRNAARVGRETTVLIDGIAEDGRLIARTPGQAPEVDSVTWLPAGAGVAPGQLRPARIVGADGYDLLAQPIGDPIAQTAAEPDELFTIYQPCGVALADGEQGVP